MKSFTHRIDPLTGEEFYEVYLQGQHLLSDALLNKASAFTMEERDDLGLAGLLRPSVNTIEQQAERVAENYARKTSNIERFIYLQGLLDRNETLFYRVLLDHLEEMLPIVYTPTVGEACLQASHLARRDRGLYISQENLCHIDQIFERVHRDIALIVVTDGERILGLGDLGSDGMPIPIGKLNLYVAAAGIHPACCLPICLDVGTNNQRLLEDPMYLGCRHPRLTGAAYDSFVERFVVAVRRWFPHALLQWEDFAKHTAFKLLERYRERVLSFDDDIQGTGATALAALMTAMRLQETPFTAHRFIIVGMGQAGTGIAQGIRSVLRLEGVADRDIPRHVLAIDAPGLLFEDTPGLEEHQRPFAQPRDAVAGWKLASPDRITLLDVIRNSEASILAGVTAQAGLFSHEVLDALARNSKRPVVLPLSNPTVKSECTPEDVMRATEGRGLVATGSPFAPLEWNGRPYLASQCNNLYVFPGMGLGALVSRTLKITEQMFFAASEALSTLVTAEQRAQGLLLPEMKDIRKVSRTVAKAVAQQARKQGLGRALDDEELDHMLAKVQWKPHYYAYRAGRNGDNR